MFIEEIQADTLGSINLKQQRQNLISDLREAVGEGDAATVIRTQALLQKIDPLIWAAEIAEAKQKLKEIQRRLAELKDEADWLESEREARQKVRAEKFLELEAATAAVREIEIAQFQTDNENLILLDSRRELNRQLESFITDKLEEIEENGN